MISCKRVWPVLALVALAGCGYRVGSLIPPDVKSVHIKMFDNLDFRHEIEIPLTQAVKDEVARRTPLKLKPAELADSVLSGKIIEVRASGTVYDTSDLIYTQQVTVKVAYEWRRRRDGRVLSSGSLSSSAQLLAARGETQGVGTNEAFADLAELIVEHMQEGF